MKTLFLILSLASFIYSQDSKDSTFVTRDELNGLSQLIQKEDWTVAASKADEFIKRSQNDSILLPNLKYVLLLTSAAKVATEKMSYEELQNISDKYIGSLLALPSNPIKTGNGPCFNYYCAGEEENTIFSAATDKKGLHIFCFINANIGEKFDAKANAGRRAAIKGKLKSITCNPNKSNIWIMRLELEPATIEYRN